MSVLISHGRVYVVLSWFITHAKGTVTSRKTTAETRVSVAVLLTASKQNLRGTEDRTVPRRLRLKATWLWLQTSICWCQKTQKAGLNVSGLLLTDAAWARCLEKGCSELARMDVTQRNLPLKPSPCWLRSALTEAQEEILKALFSISSECKARCADYRVEWLWKHRGDLRLLVSSLTLYAAKTRTVIRSYLLKGRNIPVKSLKAAAFRSQKGAETFLLAVFPRWLKRTEHKDIMCGGVRPSSRAAALPGTAI